MVTFKVPLHIRQWPDRSWVMVHYILSAAKITQMNSRVPLPPLLHTFMQGGLKMSATDLARQADKIEAFVNWSGMAVNVKKCAVTGILWGQARRNGNDKVLSSKMMKILQQRLETITIYNTPIPFLHPHTEPYRYLGVDITPTFNWAHILTGY